MQKTIYFKDGVYERIREISERSGLSVSAMIAEKFPEKFCGNKVIDPGAEIFNRLDEIERKIDNLATVYKIEHEESPGAKERSITFVDTGGEPFEGHPDSEVIAEVVPDEEKIDEFGSVDLNKVEPDLLAANERLLAKRIETKKGPVKANAALENFFKPQPKAKWKGVK